MHFHHIRAGIFRAYATDGPVRGRQRPIHQATQIGFDISQALNPSVHVKLPVIVLEKA